jgi:hypothetical protein
MSIFARKSKPILESVIPIDLYPADVELLKETLRFMEMDTDVTSALWGQSKAEMVAAFLFSKYDQEAKTRTSNAELVYHTVREKWMDGSGFTVAKVESKTVKDQAYQEAKKLADVATFRADYFRQLLYAVKNRQKALEQIANTERLEQRLDSNE